MTESRAETVVEGIYKDMERRIAASPPGICPVDLTWAFLKMCHAQTCGKCVPCRVGLSQMSNLMEDVMKHHATMETLEKLENLAKVISESADCAIGIEAARMVLKGLDGFREDYVSHVVDHHCIAAIPQSIPAWPTAPPGGYSRLCGPGGPGSVCRCGQADPQGQPVPHGLRSGVRAPLRDPLPPHPAGRPGEYPGPEAHRGGPGRHGARPQCMESTGKKVAIIGGGPSGLSAAYYLQLMGHQCTVFEKHKRLGGMLVYGIPCLPSAPGAAPAGY